MLSININVERNQYKPKLTDKVKEETVVSYNIPLNPPSKGDF